MGTSTGLGGLCGQHIQGKKPRCVLGHAKGTNPGHWPSHHLTVLTTMELPGSEQGKPQQQGTSNLGVEGKGMERAGPLRAPRHMGPYAGAE